MPHSQSETCGERRMSAFAGNNFSVPCSYIARWVIVMSANSETLADAKSVDSWVTNTTANHRIATWVRARWVSISNPLPAAHTTCSPVQTPTSPRVCTELGPWSAQARNTSCKGRHVEEDILLEALEFDTRTIRFEVPNIALTLVSLFVNKYT